MASIQLAIADPCHENWNDMLPEEKGRFCLSCQKTVVDFTNMTDGQVFDYFKNYKGNTCGQFAPEQLNRNIAKPATYSIGRWKYFWQILLPAVFTFYKSEAQTLKGKVSSLNVCKADTGKPQRVILGGVRLNSPVPKYELQGTILNEKQEAVPNTTIVSQSGKATMADSVGHFSMEIVPGKHLTISSVGYETRELSYDSIMKVVKKVEVNKSNNSILMMTDIQLKQEVVLLGEVAIVGPGTRSGFSGVSGGVTRIKRNNFFSPPKKTEPAIDFPSLKIFPNPIHPRQTFLINLQVKKMGNYLLRITDAAGKIMLEEKLNITGKNQIIAVNGNALQQAGIYLVNIFSSTDKKNKGIAGKIVVE